MSTRPKIKIKLTSFDKAIELLASIAVLGIWFVTLSNYMALPKIIPIHYNLNGVADGFGNKANILLLPIIATLMFIGMTILNKYPHIFNYQGTITEQNAFRKYTNATRLLRIVKLITVIIFGLIVLKIIQDVGGDVSGFLH